MTEEQISGEFLRLKKRERNLWIVVISVAVLFGFGLCGEACFIHKLAHAERLSLRRLDIVDDHGISRVILAAPVPPATRFGKAVGNRNGPFAMSGILIADGTGTERGGYVTADGYANAMLTLDGQSAQTTLLLTEPNGHTLFRIWNADKSSLVMGVSDNNPFLNVNQDGKAAFSAPANNPEVTDPRPLFK